MRATMVLDCSGSMGFTGGMSAPVNGQPVSKFDYARYVAAALSYLMIKQQDAVGLVTFDDQVRTMVRAASRPSQVRLVLGEMDRSAPGNDTQLARTLHEVADRIPPRGMVMLFSDMFEKAEQVIEALHHFRFCHHELVLFHIMAEEELTFPYAQSQEFKDLEGVAGKVKIDPRSVRAAYLQKVKDHVQKIENACGQLKADYVPVSTRTPIQRTVADFLARRSARRA